MLFLLLLLASLEKINKQIIILMLKLKKVVYYSSINFKFREEQILKLKELIAQS